MSAITNVQQKVQEFASENATTLLTAGGVVGTVATAVLAGRASIKASHILEEARTRKELEEADETEETKLTLMEKVTYAGPHFITPVLAGGLTITAIIMSHRISAKETAALAAAYGISRKQLEEYKAKIEEKLTGPKAQQVKDEIRQDAVNENPPSKQTVIIAGGDALCYDKMSGRYFRSSVEQIKRAESEINQQLFDSHLASLSEFYRLIGLPETSISDIIGWSTYSTYHDGVLEFEITATIAENGQPCLVIDPSRSPEPNYTKLIHE